MNDISAKEEFSVKIQKWFKENISIIAIILVSIVYIFYGVITIDKTGKSIGQIISDGAVSFLVGYAVKCLLNTQGLVNGERSESFVSSKKFYLRLLDETSNIQHYLPRYCDMENEKTLKRVQVAILRTHNIKYEDFINNNLDYQKLDKKQLKAVYKARSVTINLLNDAILLSDSQVSLDTGKDLRVNKINYLKSSNVRAFIIGLLFGALFGYYGIVNQGLDWANAIWCAIQIAIYLAFGAIQYFSAYTFMADTYKTALVRKANHLERFKNMHNENPDIFKTEEELEKAKLKEEENYKKELLENRIHDLEELIEELTKKDLEEDEENKEEIKEEEQE